MPPVVVDNPASVILSPVVVDNPVSVILSPVVVDNPASVILSPVVVDNPASVILSPVVVDNPASFILSPVVDNVSSVILFPVPPDPYNTHPVFWPASEAIHTPLLVVSVKLLTVPLMCDRTFHFHLL